ncbi:dihydrolipoyllysine-residue succinyltransferase [Buchnera aphidicola]|uniref:dihydrolipoyllysine-residue succinyltransferase n=1 Tax=Buchnera aphidicola TaxID=9 RepID=UPI0031B8AF89
MKKINILAPELPESISEATIIKWYKNINEYTIENEKLLDIETDKIVLEIYSPKNGKIIKIFKKKGDLIQSNEILGIIKKKKKKNKNKFLNNNITKKKYKKKELLNNNIIKKKYKKKKNKYFNYSPSIRRSMKKNKSLKIFKKKKNIINKIKKKSRKKKCIPMSNIRKYISKKLLKAKNNSAIVTTFNEVNMLNIINIRKKYGEVFKKKHNIKLGFMSFYVKAVVESLKKFPIINAYIDKNNIVYYKYFDISIAVSTSKGLITPILKNSDKMNIVEIENKIKELAYKGENNKLSIKELQGGNFTISNGGIYGSLLSTPIINFPQSAILGMHSIQKRAIIINNKIKIMPMMYLALSYDHRLIDGKDAINFLKNIKEIIEDHIRILLNL